MENKRRVSMKSIRPNDVTQPGRPNGLTRLNLPVYAKASLLLVGFCAFVYILFITQQILLPIIFATIVAVLLSPIVKFLGRHHVPRILAIVIAVLLAMLVTFALVYFISSQINSFAEASPRYKDKLDGLLKQTIAWVSIQANMAPEKLTGWLAKAQSEVMKNSGIILGQTLSTLGGFFLGAVLLPVYVIMILWYQPLLREFSRRVFMRGDQSTVNEVLVEAETLIQSYFIGLLFEFAIIATLDSIGLLILGIDYAILLGIIGALLNVIPLIGGVTTVAISMMVALVTKDSPSYALLVMVMFVVIQFFDNHFIIPKVVASKVKLNALISVIVVLAGGALWGILGMFLSIPLSAIAKVIFDRIEPLKPWGFLLGDIMPAAGAPGARRAGT
jgi:predicted PurR-regulated permease PerM